VGILAITLASILGNRATAGTISYQGELIRDGNRFEGVAPMKFVLCKNDARVWSSDPNAVGCGQPGSAISVSVADGIFSVYLGGPGMPPIVGAGSADLAGAVLRVWVDTGSGFEALPDQLLASAPTSLGVVQTNLSANNRIARWDGTKLTHTASIMDSGVGVQSITFADGSVMNAAPGRWMNSGSNTTVTSGNVGIGTTTPDARLDILFNSPTGQNKAVEFDWTGAGASTFDLYRNSTANGQAPRRFQILGGNDFAANTSFTLGMSTNHPLSFMTSNVERMRITAAGNIGINKTDPFFGTVIDIAADSNGRGFIRTIADQAGYQFGRDEGNAWGWNVRGDVGGNNNDLKLLRYRNGQYAGIPMQVQNATGFVGFGTETPSHQLTVNGSVAFQGTGALVFADGSSVSSAARLADGINIQVGFSTPVAQTWTAPAAITRARFRVWGAGGGGSSSATGGGGGSGGFTQFVVTNVVAGEVFDLVIGAGGAANGAGGLSRVIRRSGAVTLAVSNGGAGGSGSNGGAGGAAPTGQVRVPGNRGDSWGDGGYGGIPPGDTLREGVEGTGGNGNDPDVDPETRGEPGHVLVEY